MPITPGTHVPAYATKPADGACYLIKMVIVWGSLAKGNQEQNVITTSINTFTIMFLYAPVVILLTGVQGIDIDKFELFISVLVFIGIPMLTSLVSRKLLIKRKGRVWFETVYRPLLGKIAIIALLFTLILLFTLNGEVLMQNPQDMLLVSVPLLIGFVIIVALNILLTKLFKLKYKEAIVTVIIGSSSHFEIAIATAIALGHLEKSTSLPDSL
ncbi:MULTISPECIES: arsenic resistance protein [unclassified Synechococcus]|uniref:arsenic resistance protein n=1 Tax=unclassified Synechococcus TaxID=2626047 RepID=UPI000A04A766|nr:MULTISPECIES: bile acid:sodium symporter [unclassified Synechococcus]WFN57727.1 bile acid:sodium symporter [Synechococcus sp. CCFWC 502]